MRRHVSRIRCTAVMSAAVVVLGAVSALPASASSGGGGVERSGRCSQGSEWRLKAEPQQDRIRVEAEVDSGVKGQHWSWILKHNGGVSARGNSVTKGGGSFK